MIIGICDDMPQTVSLLQEMVESYFNEKLLKPNIKTFLSGTELLECPEEIDILFLDIELGDYNALDLIKAYRSKYRNTLLIIVTSYEQYLDDAMDLDILRYIDKPIQKERIFSALARSIEILDSMLIYVTDKNNKIFHIRKRDIIYIESYLKQVHIHTKNETIITNTSLKELRGKILSTSYFSSPHNSYIVNLNYVMLYSRTKVSVNCLDKEIEIPVSSRKQSKFKNEYVKFMKEGYTNVKNIY